MSNENEPNKTSEIDRKELEERYYNWVRSFYPVDEFEIQNEKGEPIKFTRWRPIAFDETEKEHLIYFADKKVDPEGKLEVAATIWAFLEEKKFNFLVDSERKGYGKAIYKNVQKILEILQIEDREDYYVTVAHQSEHEFLQYMKTQDLIDYTKQEPNEENAKKLLDKFAKHKFFIDLNQINCIIEYMRASGINDTAIVNSLNENGFLVKVENPNDLINWIYSAENNSYIKFKNIDENALKKFKDFKLLGLKATSMHKTIMRSESFTPLSLITDIDKKDVTLEFRKVIQDLQTYVVEQRENNGYIPPDLDEYGEVEHIVLNWNNTSLVLKNLMESVQETVKSGLISRLNDFDKPRSYKILAKEPKTVKTMQVLAESMPLNKDDYISMYMKMLNRNYTLEEFQDCVKQHNIFDRGVIEEANFEISQNSYYPDPKNNWIDDGYNKKLNVAHQRREIDIRKISKDPKELRAIIKDEIVKKGDAKRKKIKTDMTGRTEDGKTIIVDNLKDWLFGVPGAPGNLRIKVSSKKIVLPPQTPPEAVNLIEKIVNNRFYGAPNGVGEGR